MSQASTTQGFIYTAPGFIDNEPGFIDDWITMRRTSQHYDEAKDNEPDNQDRITMRRTSRQYEELHRWQNFATSRTSRHHDRQTS